MTTTAQVREAYQMSEEGLDFKASAEMRGAEFDEWLANERAESRKAGFIAGGIAAVTGATYE